MLICKKCQRPDRLGYSWQLRAGPVRPDQVAIIRVDCVNCATWVKWASRTLDNMEKADKMEGHVVEPETLPMFPDDKPALHDRPVLRNGRNG